jgi:hypothetical protein
MKKSFTLVSFCFFCLFILFSAFEDDWLTTLISKFNQFAEEHPQEKVHLHFDKPYYSMGDEVWFKAYVVNTDNNELSALSNILYVDFVDERDSVHQTVVVPINNGLGNGDIKLTDSLFTTGNYHIKAYTRWMLNYSSDFIFNKDIIIGDARTQTSIVADAKFSFDQQSKLKSSISFVSLTDKTPLQSTPFTYTLLYKNKVIASGKAVTDNDGNAVLTNSLKDEYKNENLYLQTNLTVNANTTIKRGFVIKSINDKIDIQFFPEGGRLVNGLRSKVGFKAVKPNGLGADLSGYVIDQNNKLIVEFASEHAGMGVFVLQPVAGNNYTAIIKSAAGTETRYPLQAAESEGYVLGINHTPNDSLTIRVSTSRTLITGKELALIAQQNGVVKFVTKIKADQPSISARLSNSKFNTGIVQFTLLTPDAVPVAERLVFVDRNDQLKLKVTTDKEVYAIRDKVQMQLNVTDFENKPVHGSFSVAVTDNNMVKANEDDETSIYSNLLLTSDLKGFIEKPNYYFNNASTSRSKHLDYLLLTQGWRRFSWSDLKAGKIPENKYSAQKSLGITGTITTLNNKPIPFGKVTLYGSTPNGPIMLDTVADANGNFVIDSLSFNNDVKFTVRAKNAKDRNKVKIILYQLPKPDYKIYPAVQDGLLSTNIADYLKATQKSFDLLKYGIQEKTIMLNEVNVKDKRLADKNVVKGSKRIGLGTPDLIIRKDRLRLYNNILYAFYGLAGIEVKNNMVYRVGRTVSMTRSSGVPMAVSVNGGPIQPEMLKDINPADVEGIEILKSGSNTAVYGDAGYWGVIEITLKSGMPDGDNRNNYSTNVNQVIIKGYSPEKEFYSPVYDNVKQSRNADLRSTIYWNPNIVTTTDGKAAFSYFTADEPGNYRVIIEGINLDGKLARQKFTIYVK